MKDDQLLGRIVLNPKVMVGKPVFRGTRLTVDYILNLLAHGGRHPCLFPFRDQSSERDRLHAFGSGAHSMRFLVDECTGPAVAAWLRDQNHNVFSVFDQARGMDDDDIIRKALDE